MSLPRRDALARLSRAAAGGLLSVDAAASALEVSTTEAATKLARLERAGWLTRARRGLYLIRPIESEPGVPVTVEDPWVLARALFAPCYIAGWSAAEHWGLTEQIFRSTLVATAAPRRSSKEQALSAEFRVVRVKPERLRGTTEIWRGGERVAVSDRERTIVDAVVDPAWVGGVRHLAEILVTYRRSEEFDAPKLIARLAEIGNGAAYKRMGYLAEALWPGERSILEAGLAHRTQGVIRLDPAVKSRGRMSKRWGLWVNATITSEPDRDDS